MKGQTTIRASALTRVARARLRRVVCRTMVLAIAFVPGACMSAGEHRRDVEAGGDRLSVGTVQRKVSVGMSGAAVTEALGSPNVVTTDEKRREVWIYDRISTERVRSSDAGGGALLFFGYSRSASASSTSQRTLTVIIKFDEEGKVRDFAYHSARF